MRDNVCYDRTASSNWDSKKENMCFGCYNLCLQYVSRMRRLTDHSSHVLVKGQVSIRHDAEIYEQ